jgi:hypothetical protein
MCQPWDIPLKTPGSVHEVGYLPVLEVPLSVLVVLLLLLHFRYSLAVSDVTAAAESATSTSKASKLLSGAQTVEPPAE